MNESIGVQPVENLELDLTSANTAKEESRVYEQERKRNEHKRTESLRKICGNGINWIVISVIVIIIVILLIVTWHHLTPESWRWLDDSDLSKLHSVLFSGAVVSAVTMHLNKNL